MKSVYAIKTDYPHWGKHTGFNQLGSFIDAEKIRLRHKKVSMGPPQFIKAWVSRLFTDKIKQNGGSVYSQNDWLAEIGTFLHCLFKHEDIVHLFDAEHSLKYLPALFARYRRLKHFPAIIAMLHQPPHILETLIDPDIVAQTDCILVVSPCQKEYLKKLLPQARIELLPLGVDTDYFKPGAIEKKSGVFKCLAGGVWLRDYKALLATAMKLREHPEFEFHIVTKSLDIPEGLDSIVLHSGITDKEFLELYRTCHLLFMPMLSATANNVILEGISCGLPVLTTDLPATRYYLPGPEAKLIKDNDPEQFADMLVHLHQNPRLVSEMSRKARERALTFSWTRIIKEYERLYLSLSLNSERGNPS